MAETLIASAAVLVAGLLVLWWARACRHGTLPKNWVLGYRTPLTLRDREAWIAVNRASAPLIAIAGVGPIAAAVVGIVLSLIGVLKATPVLLGSSLVWILIWALLGILPAARAERAYRRQSNKT